MPAYCFRFHHAFLVSMVVGPVTRPLSIPHHPGLSATPPLFLEPKERGERVCLVERRAVGVVVMVLVGERTPRVDAAVLHRRKGSEGKYRKQKCRVRRTTHQKKKAEGK